MNLNYKILPQREDEDGRRQVTFFLFGSGWSVVIGWRDVMLNTIFALILTLLALIGIISHVAILVALVLSKKVGELILSVKNWLIAVRRIAVRMFHGSLNCRPYYLPTSCLHSHYDMALSPIIIYIKNIWWASRTSKPDPNKNSADHDSWDMPIYGIWAKCNKFNSN